MKYHMGATVFLHLKMAIAVVRQQQHLAIFLVQLSYQPGMGARTVNISVNKPSNIRKHAFVLT